MKRFHIARRWVVLGVSLGVLLAIAGVGTEMNQSALKAAESIHRADSSTLVKNNAILASRYNLLSAKELVDFAARQRFTLRPADPGDRSILRTFHDTAYFFRAGVALTDLNGTQLNAVTGGAGLPPPTDPGYQSLRAGLAAHQPGISSVMMVGNVAMVAIAVPVRVGDLSVGLLIGYTTLQDSPLQAFVHELGDTGQKITMIIDSTGTVVASNRLPLLGTKAHAEVVAAGRSATTTSKPAVVAYTANGIPIIAIVQGMTGGWANVHYESEATFYGPSRNRSHNINLALLGMLLVAGAALTTMNHRAESARRRSEERFRALVQNASDVITVLDADGVIEYDSPSVTTVLGYSPGARLGFFGSSFLHPEDQESARASFARALAEPSAAVRLQARIRNAAGTYLWVDLSVTNLLGTPAIAGLVINGRDISESRTLQEQIAHQATHDPLTGLPNRRLFQRRLEETFERRTADGNLAALIFIDLDGFKPVNDVLGHTAGDELLRQVSERFQSCLRPSVTLARVGGDEFAILLDKIVDISDAVGVAGRLVASLHAPFFCAGEVVRIGASVGVSLTAPGKRPAVALREADAAMYRAKKAGGHRVEVANRPTWDSVDTPARR